MLWVLFLLLARQRVPRVHPITHPRPSHPTTPDAMGCHRQPVQHHDTGALEYRYCKYSMPWYCQYSVVGAPSQAILAMVESPAKDSFALDGIFLARYKQVVVLPVVLEYRCVLYTTYSYSMLPLPVLSHN